MDIVTFLDRLHDPNTRQSPYFVAFLCVFCLGAGFATRDFLFKDEKENHKALLDLKSSQLAQLQIDLAAAKEQPLALNKKLADAESTLQALKADLASEKATSDQLKSRLNGAESEKTEELVSKQQFDNAIEQLETEQTLRSNAEQKLKTIESDLAEKNKALEAEQGAALAESKREQQQLADRLKQSQKEIDRLTTQGGISGDANPSTPQCVPNYILVAINGDRPLVTCAGQHIVTLSRLTDSAYISIDGQDRTNIRKGASAKFPQGCSVSLHAVRQTEADISVVCDQ